ncbi:MAG TPA: ABC transporter permease [Usitatibacter sp.]|nr:ABC transporter permease [Usitatibacter sp.]
MSALHAPSSRATLPGLLPHVNLIRELVRRDVRERYSGSILGMVWALLTPIVLITIYSIVFGAVFGSRIPGMEKSGTFAFGVYLYSGLLVYTIFGEVLGRSPTLIWSHPSYVKKVVFPLEVLPMVVLVSALVHSVLPFAVLILAMFLVLGSVPATALLYPLIVMLMLPMLMGFAWAIAALGAYVRDLGQVIALMLTVLMFLSPIFFPISKFPAWIQPFVRLNPICIPIELCNAALFGSPAPPMSALVVYVAASAALFFAGWKVFQVFRDGFADVI